MVRCAACGEDTVIVTGEGSACAVCGAGVGYRRKFRFGKKRKAKPCSHKWGYLGKTTETGVLARKERCTNKGCIAARLVEVE